MSADVSTITTYEQLTALLMRNTNSSWRAKIKDALSVVEELANDTSQLTTTTRPDISGAYSAPTATKPLPDLEIQQPPSPELPNISELMAKKFRKYWAKQPEYLRPGLTHDERIAKVDDYLADQMIDQVINRLEKGTE